jgi:ParE-like toxin of type II ParDE toxin-antitoxin system
MMEVRFLAPAHEELVEAVGYYDGQRRGLGSRFSEEVKKTIERILQYPEAWSKLSAKTRRCPMNKFPYGVIYQLRGDVLLIVGVMHLHREPKSWMGRVPPDIT